MCAAVGCGGGDDDPVDDGSLAVPAPRVPEVTVLRPDQAPLFGVAFTMELDGDAFDADAVVLFDGVPLATRVGSATHLEADVPAEALESPGVRAVTVLHTEAGGGVSREHGFAVVDGIAAPVVDALVPDRANIGALSFQVTIAGWNFYPTSVVSWAGAPRTTTYVNASTLQVTIDPTDLIAAGDVTVVVTTETVSPSAELTFVIEAAPLVATTRLTVTPSGGESTGGDASDPSISADGRFVAFASFANDLVPNDSGRRDVFVRDTCRGAIGCTPSTIRVSEKLGGGTASEDSQDPMISANGRYVAFSSAANDLVAGDTGFPADVFVRDTCIGASGCTPSTIKVSEIPIAYFFAIQPSISADGRFIAFTSDTDKVWLRDTCLGAVSCTPATIRVDAAPDGTPGDKSAESPAISANGRYVAFKSESTNLDGPSNRRHGHLYDSCFGASGCTPSIIRLDIADDGTEANGEITNGSLSTSADGRYVSFTSGSTNLVPAATTIFQVYVRDTCVGAVGCTPSTTLVSQTAAGTGSDGFSFASCLSPTARFIVFQSDSSDLAAGDTNGRRDVFLRDLCIGTSGCTPVTRRVSVGFDGSPGDNHTPVVQEYSPRISADGAVTTWASRATNIIANDTNGADDIFVSTGTP